MVCGMGFEFADDGAVDGRDGSDHGGWGIVDLVLTVVLVGVGERRCCGRGIADGIGGVKE